jgi:hypothetical protein
MMVNLGSNLKNEGTRDGLLIDLDCAKDLEEVTTQTRPEITV